MVGSQGTYLRVGLFEIYPLVFYSLTLTGSLGEETTKQIQKWRDPNALIDGARNVRIKQHWDACAHAFRYAKNRVGSYIFRHPDTRKSTFDASNGDWESHVMEELSDGLEMTDTYVSPIFSDTQSVRKCHLSALLPPIA